MYFKSRILQGKLAAHLKAVISLSQATYSESRMESEIHTCVAKRSELTIRRFASLGSDRAVEPGCITRTACGRTR